MSRRVDSGRRRNRWRRVAGASVSTKMRRVEARSHRRNIDLAFKKPNLRTTTKTATDARRMMANTLQNFGEHEHEHEFILII